MNDERIDDSVLRLLRLLGERLDNYLEGDELAFETMGESIEERGFSADDIHAAVLVLRSLGATAGGTTPASLDSPAGKHAQRVLSAEERKTVSPEAWGYLIDLRHRGSLSSEQYERVLDILSGCGVRPVGVDLAREVASRVALSVDDQADTGDLSHGDCELTH